MTDFDSAVRDQAYAIWEAEGRPHGREVDHWLAAEAVCRSAAAKPRQSRARRKPSSETASTPTTGSSRSTKRKTKSAA